MTTDDLRFFKDLLQQKARTNSFWVFLIITSIFVTSCNKPGGIGLNVRPSKALLNVGSSDTITLITKTVKTDTLRTDENITKFLTGNVLIGTYLDPIFGRTSVSVYTQIALTNDFPSFGSNPKIDSVILTLVYDSVFYGKKQHAKQNISVYQVVEHMWTSNNYYSNTSLTISPIDLANNFAFVPNFFDSITVDSSSITKALLANNIASNIETIVPPTRLVPQLRVPLEPLFGQKILSAGAQNFMNNESLQDFIKGLFITTENTTGLTSGEGNIYRFQLEHTQSNIELYYHNDSSVANNFNYSLQYNFRFFPDSAARFTTFKNSSLADANLISQLSNSPPAQNDIVFLQPGNTRILIETPYLMNLIKSGPVAIDKAELIIKAIPSSTYQLDTFLPPPQLVLHGVLNDGERYSVPDSAEGWSYYGGNYNPSTQEYIFNIGRYIQQVLSGKRANNGLYLLVLYEFIDPERVVLGGGGNGKNSGGNLYQMKLIITQTKVP